MTVIINTEEELEALVDKNNNIIINDDLMINCDIDIDVFDIEAKNIKARDIKARNIDAYDIKAYNIDADNIEAWNIRAWNIEARDINANNIDANNINAYDINYQVFCIAYKSLKCKTIKGRRQNVVHLCLDQPIEYIK